MDCIRDFVFTKLCEAISWVKSQLEAFCKFLSKKINESVNHARRFFDNFSEKLKQALIASNNIIDATIHKIVEIMCSIKRLICSSLHTFKEKISLLVDWTSVLIEKLKNLYGYINSFSCDVMEEIQKKTMQRCKSSLNSDYGEKFHWLSYLIERFFALLKILLVEALLLYLKNQPLDDKEAAKFV